MKQINEGKNPEQDFRDYLARVGHSVEVAKHMTLDVEIGMAYGLTLEQIQKLK